MPNKSSPRLPVAPLQRVVAEEITDQAEKDVLDEQRRREREAAEAVDGRSDPEALLAGVNQALEMCKQLPPDARLSVLVRLGAELSPAGQRELMAQIMDRLSPDALGALAKDLACRLGTDPQ